MNMKLFILILLSSFTLGCQDMLKELFFPADEHLVLPTGKRMRLHCNPECPPHDEIMRVMIDTREYMLPHVSYDPWRVWSAYAINFDRREWILDDGRQVWGATAHNMQAIYIHYEDEYQGIRPGVLDWELKLPLVEKEIPRTTEEQKIEWMDQRGILHGPY